MNYKENQYPESKSKVKSTLLKQIYQQSTDQNVTSRLLLSNLRHELRTPLNAIVGYSEMLLEDAQELGNENLVSNLQVLQTEGQVLHEKINDFFDTSNLSVKLEKLKDEKVNHKFRHDLGVHLNTLIEYCSTLQEDPTYNIISNFGEDVKKIHTAAETLLTRIDAILTNDPVAVDKVESVLDASYTLATSEKDEHTTYPISDDRASFILDHERSVLVVDDNSINRDLLSRYLKRMGLVVTSVENGVRALEMVDSQPFDLILLDVLMPDINGYQVLKRLKNNKAWRDIPVIMISALTDTEGVVKCIEIGADDYLPKPFNSVVLKARIDNCLARKRLSDLEKAHKKLIKETFGRYVSHEVRDEVLSGRIPLEGEKRDVTVLFADLQDFTPLTESMPPKEMVRILNSYFSEMAPAIRSRHGSILQYLGDEIYAVFGAPIPLSDHPRQAVSAALDMRQRLIDVNKLLTSQGHAVLKHGIGIHSGSVVAANIGCSDRLSYGLVGDTVNLASRIQGLTKKFSTDIIISAQSRARLGNKFEVEELPATFVKGKNASVEIYKVL